MDFKQFQKLGSDRAMISFRLAPQDPMEIIRNVFHAESKHHRISGKV